MKLPHDVAYVDVEGYELRVSQHDALQPLHVRLGSRVEVLAEAEAFVAYNGSALELLQPGSPVRMGEGLSFGGPWKLS